MADAAPGFHIGQRVVVRVKGEEIHGSVRFLGPTEFSHGEWLGVELDEPKGKNDGTVSDVKYFDAPSGHGLFVRPEQARLAEDGGATAGAAIHAARVLHTGAAAPSRLADEQSDTEEDDLEALVRFFFAVAGKPGATVREAEFVRLLRTLPGELAGAELYRECLAAAGREPDMGIDEELVRRGARAGPLETVAAALAARQRDMLFVGCRASFASRALGRSLRGTVRFRGSVGPDSGEMVGLELDERCGKNDGSLAGVCHFQCPDGHGLFCQASRLRPLRPRRAAIGEAEGGSVRIVEKIVEVPVVTQVEKIVQVPMLHEQIVHVPVPQEVVKIVHVPMVQEVIKIVEVPAVEHGRLHEEVRPCYVTAALPLQSVQTLHESEGMAVRPCYAAAAPTNEEVRPCYATAALPLQSVQTLQEKCDAVGAERQRRRKEEERHEEEEEPEIGDVLPLWEPTLGEVSRPEWLPMKGPGNMKVEPEMWGMTVQQFCAFIMACFMGDPRHGGGTLAKHAEKRPDKTEAKHANFVTLYDIVDKFVKPWTSNTGNSIALLMNAEAPLKAEVMISHAWGEDIIEAMVAVLGKAFATGMPLSTSVWFCAFAQYQPGDQPGDCGPGVAEQLALDPFKKVIDSCPPYGMLVLHTSRAELYGRLWCVYEVNEALAAGVEPHAAVSMNYLVDYYAKRRTASSEELCRVETDKATCFSDSDRDMIRGRIEQARGFKTLDETISRFRRGALDQMYGAATTFFEWSRKHKLGRSDEQRAVWVLRDQTRTAGVFVALHCLLAVCNQAAYTDDEYRKRIFRLARQALLPLGQHRHRDGEHPPRFDPEKASVEQLERLLNQVEDDDHLQHCLSNLGEFQLPVGYLEMSAGGREPAMPARSTAAPPAAQMPAP